uniref:Uncharacterized protein TCIL3000_8_2590 n=1 Tax=Trypanosoma congolense (strain IL3000) TaxID=1068625 RepID=G0URM8_TRYCI|nr:unnamed protein product [Trypanosoma congolense IL3000]
MLDAFPPIVVLPSNPADVLRPVPIFARGVGLYNPSPVETRDSHWGVNGSANAQCLGGAAAHQASGGEGKGAVPEQVPPCAGVKGRSGEEISPCDGGGLANGVTEKEVDVLLEILGLRYERYVELKQNTTERYLARIEADVDRFLMSKYGSSSSIFGDAVTSFIKKKLSGPFPLLKPKTGADVGKQVVNELLSNGGGISSSESVVHGLPAIETCTYTPQCIPFNYLDVPPANMGAIAANLVVLQNCLGEHVARGSPEWKQFLKLIIHSVWDQELNPLLRNATELLRVAQQNVWPPLEHSLRQSGNANESTARRSKYDHVAKGLRGDLHYLEVIRGADQLIIDGQLKEGAGPADFVPVGGLVLSRLYRLENEHRTAWEFWRSR